MNKTQIWKQASEVYADISELSQHKATAYLYGIKNITSDVREAVITLINSGSQASAYFSDNIAENYNFDINNNKSFQTGQQLDEYELLEELGKGGMSQVFKAQRITNQQQTPVAIKIFAPGNNSSELLNHFLNEQKILADLSHPHIVKMLHGGMTDDNTAYLVMELIQQALPLDKYCKNNKLSTKNKIKLIAQCANALAYSHANLIIHRDLKPDNILINQNNELKVVDFGIAKLINKDIPSNNTLIALTPSYAAPEQINGKPIGIKTDIFSLAVVALDLLIEGDPLPKDRLIKSCANDEAHINRLISSLNTDKDLKNILATAMQQKPELRYATMNDFAEDLQAWLNGLPVSATGNTLTYRMVKFAQRRKALFASLTTLLITVILAVIALSWQYRQTVIENKKAVEIKDFMLNLFSYADPESSLGSQLTAIDLLNFAYDQVAHEKFSNTDVKADLLTNIGTSLLNLGSEEKGEELLLTAITYNPDNLKAQLRLAQMYAQSNQLDQAQELITQLERVLANNSPHPQLQPELNLLKAIVLKFKGKVLQARDLALQSYENFNQSKNYRGVLKSTGFLSDTYSHLGEYQKAVDIIQDANKFVDKQISSVTPELLRLSIRHTNLLSLLENHQEAIQLIDKTIVNIEKKLGDKHPLIILAIAEKANTLRYANKPIQAYHQAQKSHDIAVSKYGAKSKLAQNSLYVMADIQFSQGKYADALAKFEEVSKYSKINYGEHHFITINSEIGLSDFYYLTQQEDRAIKYADQLRKRITGIFGKPHVLSIKAVNAYLEILIKRKEVTAKTLNISKENFELSQAYLSDSHPLTQYSKRVMVKINDILGQEKSNGSL